MIVKFDDTTNKSMFYTVTDGHLNVGICDHAQISHLVEEGPQRVEPELAKQMMKIAEDQGVILSFGAPNVLSIFLQSIAGFANELVQKAEAEASE
jgi:hypothetical protein